MQDRTAVELFDRQADRFASGQARHCFCCGRILGRGRRDRNGSGRNCIRTRQIAADRAQLTDVTGAAAEVAEQILVDLVIADRLDSIGRAGQQVVFQGNGGQNQARAAIATLVGAFTSQAAGHPLDLVVQALNSLDRLIFSLPGQGGAGQDRLAIGKDGTETAVAGVTAALDRLVAEIAQDIEQDVRRIDFHRMGLVVDGQLDQHDATSSMARWTRTLAMARR